MVLKLLRRHADYTLRYLFVFSLCLISLLYGVVAGHFKLFPSQQLRDAKSAAEALFAVLEEEGEHETAPLLDSTPAIQNHAGIDDGARILVSGGPGFLESYNPNGGCLAWLMDRKGQIQHIWKFHPDLWADLKNVSMVPGASVIYPVDLHLLADGGLLVTFHGAHAWPYGIGMARLDKDSNTIWKKECHAHHWFTVTPDQKIITPTLRVLESPQPIGLTRGRINSESGKIIEDTISVMTLDGEVLEEISMLDVVNKSGIVGLYQSAAGTSPDVETDDPLHLNSVQLVGERVAAAHNWLNADDWLVSFRNINTVAIIDRATSRLKWHTAGTVLRQHSPTFVDSDNILIFDNLGGDESLGGTRLAKMGLESRQTEPLFPTADNPYGHKLYSSVFGHLDVNRAGDAVLMAVTNQGLVLEVGLEHPTVLWEYRYLDTVANNWQRRIQTAKYCYDVSFEMNQQKRAK